MALSTIAETYFYGNAKRATVIGGIALVVSLVWGSWDGLPRANGQGFRPSHPIAKPSEAQKTPTPAATPTTDHDKNIKALQQEKVNAWKERVEWLTRACADGYATQDQVDVATIDELRYAELEVMDKPADRIAALKKIVDLHKQFEDQDKQKTNFPTNPNDIRAVLTRSGRVCPLEGRACSRKIELEEEQQRQEKLSQSQNEPAK